MVIATSDGNVYESETHMAVETSAKPDYDYAAFQASGMEQADNGHYPDTFKLPNHMTFSEESMYHGQDGEEGGRWVHTDRENGRWSFTPGASNFKYHSLQEMQDYFKKYEPGNVLNAVAGDVVTLPISSEAEIKARIGQMNRAANDNNPIKSRPKPPSAGISGDEYWRRK